MIIAKVPASDIQNIIKENWFILSCVALFFCHVVLFKLITNDKIKSTPAKIFIYLLILIFGVISYTFFPSN